MKYIALILFIGAFVLLKSQTYFSFPSTQANWLTMKVNNYSNPTGIFLNYSMKGDTVIENILYKKIYQTNSQGTFYGGGLRELNKVIYFYPTDSSTEYVLYNFNKQLGDTIQYPYTQFGSGTGIVTVVLIDSVFCNDGQYHKRQWLAGHTTAYIIEGIGSDDGLLQAPYNSHNLYTYQLNCFSNNQQLVYGYSDDCLSSQEDNYTNSSLEIFPNPTSESINIRSDKLIKKINIYNTCGSIILSENVNSLQPTIELNISSGLYIVELYSNYGVIRKKLLLKK